MGIKGLLPFLKNASVHVNLSDFSGYVAAVDAYCWIHRSSYACASDLALGIPTDQYVRYAMKYINLMKSCNVKPILVFDGMDLPSKAETDLKRREVKEINRKKASEYLLQGNKAAAQECFERSVFVTYEMAHEVLRAARNMGVDCIVAPYEADAQLAYLNRTGYADFVITEDSDLLLFGCRQVIFKLDLSGSGVLVAAASGICECCGIPASQFTESKFRFMGIMAGCDYFSGIPGIGLTTAAKILRQTRITNFRELLSKLGFYVKLNSNALGEDSNKVTCSDAARGKKQGVKKTDQRKSSQINETLLNAAVRAERTFRLQVIFDVASRCQKRFSEPTPEDTEEEMHIVSSLEGSNEDEIDLFGYAGRVLKDNEKAFNLALGNISCSDGTVVDNYIPQKSIGGVQSNGAITGYSSIQTKIQSFKMKPNPDRLRMSIWDKNYPIQKVWLHRTQNGCIEPVSDILSIGPSISPTGKENKRPVEESPVKSLGLKRTQSTCGRQILVPATIQQSLKALTNNAAPLKLVSSSVDDTSDVLQCYGQNNEVPTTPKLKSRSTLSSSIVSASCYFPKEDKVDDVAVALDDAINNIQNDDHSVLSYTPRSPVFYKVNSNPFRLAATSFLSSSKEKVATDVDNIIKPDNEDIHDSSNASSHLKSVRRHNFNFEYFQHKKPNQSLCVISPSSCVDSNKQQNYPASPPILDLNHSTVELQDSSSGDSSPSFLNAHKFSSQTSTSLSDRKIVSIKGCIQNCSYNSSGKESSPFLSTPLKEDTINSSLEQNTVSKISDNNFKCKNRSKESLQPKTTVKSHLPVQSSNLDSFFQRWKFKRTST
ncbi:unnamed protein product [Heterobilharzia americana]|nr:unnamed protein product [Heterobilharzia americana]